MKRHFGKYENLYQLNNTAAVSFPVQISVVFDL